MRDFKLSIVTPVFNNCKFTERYLTDLVRLTPDHEIIIVDNASTDETEKVVKKFIDSKQDNQPQIVYVKNKTNEGFSRASNLGYELSKSLNVLFLNNDIYVKNNHSNWTDSLLNYCDQFLVGPTGGMLDANCNFIKETNKYEPCALFYMSGWCLASSKKNFEKLKQYQKDIPFPTHLSRAYFEDTILSLNMIRLKIPFKLEPVPVGHFGRMTSSKVGISQLYSEAKINFIKEVGKEIKDGKFAIK